MADERCEVAGCPHPPEANLKRCRGHEGGFLVWVGGDKAEPISSSELPADWKPTWEDLKRYDDENRALRTRVAELEAQIAATEPELRRVAEQQREACARALEGPHRDPATGANCYSRAPLRGNGTPLDPCCGNCARAEVVRAATLVTEGEP